MCEKNIHYISVPGQLKRATTTLLSLKDTRGSAVALALLTLIGKILGYVRTLLMAYIFGASAKMDAFYVAYGVVNLFVFTGQQSIESAVIPELTQIKKKNGDREDQNLMSIIWWISAFIAGIFAVFIILIPEKMIGLFAMGFDTERIRIGARIIVWLVPWGLATFLCGILGTWALHTSRYILPTLLNSSFNCFSIPIMLLLMPFAGILSIPGAFSLSWMVLLLIALVIVRDFPFRFTSIPWYSLKRIAKNVAFCIGLSGAETLYLVTDRFFASRLAVGAVSSISYAEMIFGIPMALVHPILLLYLAKSCKAIAEEPSLGEEGLIKAIGITWSYSLPLGMALAATATTIVSLVLGYGAFDSNAINLTGLCLTAYSIAMPLAVSSLVLIRYAQSCQKLRVIVTFSYLTVSINILLDWFLASKFGTPGIAAATSLVWCIATFLFAHTLLPDFTTKLKKGNFLLQFLFSFLWSVPLYIMAQKWEFRIVPLSTLMILLHLFLCERIGLMSHLPREWLPSKLTKFILGKIWKGVHSHRIQ